MMMLCLALWSSPALARPVVMLDPGHGGTNMGALGHQTGKYEKALTLVIARHTKKILERKLPSARVLMTRHKDRYLTLAQRVRLANAARATLFISIHLNASESCTQSGFETYLLSRKASDKESARLALRENQEPPAAGPSKAVKGTSKKRRKAVIRSILADLRHTAAHAESARLARRVQAALARVREKAHNRGVRQASFDVLMGLRMAGVLVEVGFIDHAQEGKEMARPAVQKKISQALAGAILEHLSREGRPANAKTTTKTPKK